MQINIRLQLLTSTMFY